DAPFYRSGRGRAIASSRPDGGKPSRRKGTIPRMEYWLTRLCLQRSLGLIYLIAFLIAFNQGPALIGAKGLLPFKLYLPQTTFREAPSLLWLRPTDGALTAVAVAGMALAVLAVTGVSERFGYAVSGLVWG